MNYFNNVFTTFLALESVGCVAVNGWIQKDLHLCSEDEPKYYVFEMT